MKILKKILTVLAIVTLIAIVGLLIAAIFGFQLFTGFWLKMLLTLATVTVTSTFSISALSFFNKKKIVSIVALCLFLYLTVCAFIIFWSGLKLSNIFVKITAVSALAVFLFNLIISTSLKLEGRHMVLKVITYLAALALNVMLAMGIFGVDIFSNGSWQILLVIALITFALVCTLSILGRKSADTKITDKNKNGEKLITITENEYNQLKNEVKSLQEQLLQIKSEK